MPAPAMVSARRDLDLQRVIDPFPDLLPLASTALHPAAPGDREEPPGWHPVSEQGLLAALAVTAAG